MTDIYISARRGAGAPAEILYGTVTFKPTLAHSRSTSIVLPAPTTFDLVDGEVVATNVQPTPEPVAGQIEWAYEVTFKDRHSKTYSFLVGVPDSTAQVNFTSLPRYFETKPPLFGEGPKGEPGESATVAVGTVTSGATPNVNNTGTNTDAILNFTLPKGDKGDTGTGVPTGGSALQYVRKNSGNTATEWATPSKASVGLSNVDNTSDADKPVSTATQAALNSLVDGEDLRVSELVADSLSKTAEELHKRFVAKGELVVNVQDFGAAGDGIADDTAAISDALNQIREQGGGVLWFPTATYNCVGYSKLADNLLMEMNYSVFTKPPVGSRSSYAVFASLSDGSTGYGSGVRNLVARNAVFKGSFDSASKSDICGFALHHAENALFENITFYEAISGGHAYDLNGCKNIHFRNQRFIGFLPAGGNYNRAEAIQLDMSRAGALSVLDSAGSYDGLGCENISAEDIYSLPLTVGGQSYPCPNVMGSHARREGVIHKNISMERVYIEEPMEDTVSSGSGVLFHSLGIDGLTIRGVRVVSTTGNDFRLVGLYVKVTGESSTVDPGGTSGATVPISPLYVRNVLIEYDSVSISTIAGKSYQITNYIQGAAASFAEDISVVSRSTYLGEASGFIYTRYERVNKGHWLNAAITGGGLSFSPLNCDNIKSSGAIYSETGASGEYINNCRNTSITDVTLSGCKGKGLSAYTGSGLRIVGVSSSAPTGTEVNSRVVVSISSVDGAIVTDVNASTNIDQGSERGIEIYGSSNNFVISNNVLAGYTTKVVDSAAGSNKLVDSNI